MARKPQNSPSTPGAPQSPPSGPAQSDRDRIVEAFLALLAERPIEEIDLNDIAGRAGVTLAALRGEFASTLGILAAHMKGVDRAVLAGDDGDMAEEPVRERLFDVLMRRLEVLAPHKDAIRSLVRSASRNPPLALAVNGLAVRSQLWMLAAAGIDTGGTRGMVRAQGAACLFANVLRTWLRDEDPGLARTMAALDRELARGQRWSGFLDGLCRLRPSRLCRGRPWRDRDDRDPHAAEAPVGV